MDEVNASIGVLTVDLFIGEARSLKDKRSVLRRIKDRVRNGFNVSVAELDGQDKWQTAVMGFCMIDNGQGYVRRALEQVLTLVDSCHAVEVCRQEIEFL